MSKPECPKRDGARGAPAVKGRNYLLDYLELAYVPLALGVVAAGITWVVWFLTTEPCTSELAKTAGCSLSSLGRYINLDVFNKMMVHGGIAGGFGGIGSYVMITRERQRADAAEQRLFEALQAAESERQAREAERQARERAEQQVETERQRADEARREADEAKDLYIKKLEELVAQNHNGNASGSEST